MATRDTTALERLLASLEWNVAGSKRHAHFTAWPLRARPGYAAVVYVREGTATIMLESGDGVGLARCSPILKAGDILVAAGRLGLSLRGDADTDLILTELLPASGELEAADALPDLLMVRDFSSAEPAIATLAASMGNGTCSPARVGDATVCARIATTIVTAAVRAWTELGCAPHDWLARAQDPFVGRAVDAIHAEPGRSWSVGELASVAAMSRTVFAARFRELMGESPASYLAGVRMSEAKTHLLRAGRTVSETAHLLGYDSEDGFSRAFRRHTGVTPSAWRRAQERSRPTAATQALAVSGARVGA